MGLTRSYVNQNTDFPTKHWGITLLPTGPKESVDLPRWYELFYIPKEQLREKNKPVAQERLLEVMICSSKECLHAPIVCMPWERNLIFLFCSGGHETSYSPPPRMYVRMRKNLSFTVIQGSMHFESWFQNHDDLPTTFFYH